MIKNLHEKKTVNKLNTKNLIIYLQRKQKIITIYLNF